MPYIKQAARTDLQNILNEVKKVTPLTAGQLNYLISSIINTQLKDLGFTTYNDINSLIGMLECAKLELYRRVALPYEDDKLKTNGDVYG